MEYAPVALFVYNRPWHTRQAVEALQANILAARTPLYIYSDAPRDLAARDAVAGVRAYIQSVSGFASVTIEERDENFGLACSIIDGVSRLCAEFGRVIVLEDDLITSRFFLQYMNDALTRYEHEERVMQVAGYMFPAKLSVDEDAVLLPFTSSWGWATWQRAWRHFDARAMAYQTVASNPELRRDFDIGGRYGYFRMLQSQQRGETDSWAIRWYLSVFMLHGLTLYPRKTLVRNLGFDGSGVNCVASTIEDEAIDENFQVQRLPQRIAVTSEYNNVLEGIPKPKLNLKNVRHALVVKTFTLRGKCRYEYALVSKCWLIKQEGIIQHRPCVQQIPSMFRD